MNVTKHEDLCSTEMPRTGVAWYVWGLTGIVSSTMNGGDVLSTAGCLAGGSMVGQLEREFAGSESGP